jgi:hypothetical protein
MDTSLSDFLLQVLETVKNLGGLTPLAVLSAVITLLISSLKVLPVTRLLWARLGWAQVLVAPLLGLAAGILGLGAAGAPITLPLVIAYVTAGAGSVFIHELLDALKGAPGLGLVYRMALAWVEALILPAAPRAAPAAGAAPGRPTLEDRFGRSKMS